MTIGKVHLTEKYARYRIREPSEFEKSSFRTQDIGRVGHSKRIAGRLKRSGKWATQAILIARSDYKKGLRLSKKGKGWRLEGARHALARKGIKTGRKSSKTKMKRWRIKFTAFKGTDYADSGQETFITASSPSLAIKKSKINPSAVYGVEVV